VVCATCWKLDCPAFSRHRATWAPLTGLAVRTPEITTLRPAVSGFAEEVIVRLPDGHGVAVQQLPDVQQVPAVQQVPDGQQAVAPQQVLDTGQHGVVACALAADDLVGIGQHGTICGQ
jgi:hypothetical protein